MGSGTCSCCPDRWTQVNHDIAEQLQTARGLLQLWEAYTSAHTEAVTRLDQQEAKYHQLANINMSGNNLAEILTPALRDIKVGAKTIGEAKGTGPSTRTEECLNRLCRTRVRLGCVGLGGPGGGSEARSGQQAAGSWVGVT